MKKVETIIRRIFFYGSFVLAALAALEKFLNLFDYTLLRTYYTPSRLLEFAAIGLLFVIVLQLRQIRLSVGSKSPEQQ